MGLGLWVAGHGSDGGLVWWPQGMGVRLGSSWWCQVRFEKRGRRSVVCILREREKNGRRRRREGGKEERNRAWAVGLKQKMK